jgi:hypothetical protein
MIVNLSDGSGMTDMIVNISDGSGMTYATVNISDGSGMTDMIQSTYQMEVE